MSMKYFGKLPRIFASIGSAIKSQHKVSAQTGGIAHVLSKQTAGSSQNIDLLKNGFDGNADKTDMIVIGAANDLQPASHWKVSTQNECLDTSVRLGKLDTDGGSLGCGVPKPLHSGLNRKHNLRGFWRPRVSIVWYPRHL